MEQADRTRPLRPGRRRRQRADGADAAFGKIAFDRAEPMDAARAEAGGEAVDQQGEVGRGRFAGQRALDRLGAERLDAGGDEAQPLDAEAGLDRLDLRAQQGVEMRRRRGSRGPG